MKKYNYYWAWFKGRDNQDKLATWHKIFQRSPSPRLEFCKAKSSLDGCDSMLHDDWLDIPSVVILHYFCFKPKMVSDKNTRRNIFTIMFLCSLLKGITTKSESSCSLPESACFRTEASPWETFESRFRLVRWFSLQYQPLGAYLKIHANEICNIYDKHMHL